MHATPYPACRPAAACTHIPHPTCRPTRRLPAEEKKLKLRSPNFVVSDTRLSVRNIPASWTEKQLKAAFIQAVRRVGGVLEGCRGLVRLQQVSLRSSELHYTGIF